MVEHVYLCLPLYSMPFCAQLWKSCKLIRPAFEANKYNLYHHFVFISNVVSLLFSFNVLDEISTLKTEVL